MITEHAMLFIDPDRSSDFEVDFEKAKAVVGGAGGFHGLRLLRGIESPGSYLLLIEWDSVDDHMEGFRKSPTFAEWRSLVGPYFTADPDVEHFTPRAAHPASS